MTEEVTQLATILKTTKLPQGFGSYNKMQHGLVCYCALGAIAKEASIIVAGFDALTTMFPSLRNTSIKFNGNYWTLHGALIMFNDTYRLTFNQMGLLLDNIDYFEI